MKIEKFDGRRTEKHPLNFHVIPAITIWKDAKAYDTGIIQVGFGWLFWEICFQWNYDER